LLLTAGAARAAERLVARLTTALVGTGTVNHDSRPAPGKVPTDTILSATVELVF
jgi:hypothetical protein